MIGKALTQRSRKHTHVKKDEIVLQDLVVNPVRVLFRVSGKFKWPGSARVEKSLYWRSSTPLPFFQRLGTAASPISLPRFNNANFLLSPTIGASWAQCAIRWRGFNRPGGPFDAFILCQGAESREKAAKKDFAAQEAIRIAIRSTKHAVCELLGSMA